MGGLHAWAMGRSTSRIPRGSQVRAHVCSRGGPGPVACNSASDVRAILSVHVKSPQLLAVQYGTCSNGSRECGLARHTTRRRQLNTARFAGSARHGPITYVDLRVVVSLHGSTRGRRAGEQLQQPRLLDARGRAQPQRGRVRAHARGVSGWCARRGAPSQHEFCEHVLKRLACLNLLKADGWGGAQRQWSCLTARRA